MQVIIIEGLSPGHFLNLLLDPLETLFCRLYKHSDNVALRRFVAAEDVVSQEIESIHDVGDRGFFFAEL